MSKRPKSMYRDKEPKKTKADEIAEFRAEVQNYLNTGVRGSLSPAEIAKLDASKPKPFDIGPLASLRRYF